MFPLPPGPPAFFGPLPVRLQTALSGAATQLEPEVTAPLAAGARQVRVRLDIGNNAIYHGTVSRSIYDDSEVQNLRFGEAFGTSWGEWSWQASVVQRTGGILDPLIRFWHENVVPFNDPYFKNVPNGQVKGEVYDSASLFSYSGSAAALTQVTLAAKRPLAPGISGRVVVKLPVSGRSLFLDSGTLDLGAGLLGERALTRRWRLHGNLNLVRAGATTFGTLTGGSRWLTGSTLAAEFASSPRTNLVVQLEDTAFPYERDLRGRSGRRQQTSFGAWVQQDASTRWHVSFSENIYPFLVTSYTPDVMVSLGFIRVR
ncbi:hypothetical protein [Armatimonas rosea]|uniref:DUF3187 family protein n=1 Tax=Armatimonas rosea TaxID=685828 RepID=A0A7W9SMT3_ARMRO|nr:hypothetical protein [Armatimonas rosea]MBB6049506.1 hypothetical protein [Armatimonas rosea]